MKKVLGCILLCLCLAPALAQTLPYNEHADARTEVRHALIQARSSKEKVLLVFGANWCSDCRRLDHAIDEKKGRLAHENFITVKIDVGNFNKNMDLAREFGNPIKKGIPAAVLLDADNQIEYKGLLIHLIEPYRRLIKAALYAAVLACAVLGIWAGIHFFRKFRLNAQHAN
jgi:thioredoxin 1